MDVARYVEGMTKYRELFEDNLASFRLSQDEIGAMGSLRSGVHVLVLTEDWCGDSARYLPALARVAEVAEGWDVRIFYRDAHPELAERWLKHGERRAIPVMVFFDEDWNEFACFVEKPEPVYGEEIEARKVFSEAHPELPDGGLPAGEMSPETLDIFAPYMRAFRLANTDRWEHLFVGELVERLQAAEKGEVVGAGCW
jgi:hypothetical protein